MNFFTGTDDSLSLSSISGASKKHFKISFNSKKQLITTLSTWIKNLQIIEFPTSMYCKQEGQCYILRLLFSKNLSENSISTLEQGLGIELEDLDLFGNRFPGKDKKLLSKKIDLNNVELFIKSLQVDQGLQGTSVIGHKGPMSDNSDSERSERSQIEMKEENPKVTISILEELEKKKSNPRARDETIFNQVLEVKEIKERLTKLENNMEKILSFLEKKFE